MWHLTHLPHSRRNTPKCGTHTAFALNNWVDLCTSGDLVQQLGDCADEFGVRTHAQRQMNSVCNTTYCGRTKSTTREPWNDHSLPTNNGFPWFHFVARTDFVHPQHCLPDFTACKTAGGSAGEASRIRPGRNESRLFCDIVPPFLS